MKIGILTFHRALNYGAVLQCYALKEALCRMGHDVWLIDYRPWYLESNRKVLLSRNTIRGRGVTQFLKWIFSSLLMAKSRRKTIANFNNFLYSNFKLSKPFTSLEGINADDYDGIVFGSDQIWSPSICNGFDKIYWGGVSHPNTVFFTYAASIGGHNKLNENDLSIVKGLLGNYNHISVREEGLREMLKTIFNIDAPIVCDPTLLVPSQSFDKLAKRPKEKNYTLFFALESEEGALDYAKYIAKQLNNNLVWLQTFKGLRNTKGVIKVGGVTVEEFLGYFKYANCIVSMSFHAAVFSIIFRKDFYCLECSQGDRAKNLLNNLGLGDRMVSSKERKAFKPVDYTLVSSKEEDLSMSSRHFLDRVLC